jgi:hypothetical protein
MYWPRKLPRGAAMVVARAFPPFKRASARGTSCSGTSRITVAADIDQNPPMTTPMSARPIIITKKFGASATIRPETNISVVSVRSRLRRSIRLVADVMRRLVKTAKMPEIEIAWPAWPSVT